MVVVDVELMQGMRWKGLIRSGKGLLAMIGYTVVDWENVILVG